MKSYLMRPGMACAILALQCVLTGCPWVDEEVPDRKIVDPVAYEPVPVTPEAVEGIDGYRLPTTAVIRSFLGGADFRIAISLQGEEGVGTYLLEPGDSDQSLRIRRYSNGRETIDASGASWYGYCALSPEGDRLAYSLDGAGDMNGMLAIVWMVNLEPVSALRVPLFSHRNRSYGMIGERPYWHLEGGRRYIGFRGGSLQGSVDDAIPPLGGGWESQMVEVLSDSVLSPVFPVRVGGEGVVGEVRGISRDGEWFMIREPTGMNLLLPAERVPDLPGLRDTDSLTGFLAGNLASLNPFDSGSSRHSDFYATPRFKVSESTGNKGDTVADPRTLDGRRMTASHPLAGDNFWICDAERRIHFSHKVGGEILHRVVWTTHPNFVLAFESSRAIHLIRLAGSREEVLDGGEEATRKADGVLTLFLADLSGPMVADVQDISMWIP